MPRVISDELYDQLTNCIKQQRLLGVMGMLERVRGESVQVTHCGCEDGECPGVYFTFEDGDEDAQSTDKN